MDKYFFKKDVSSEKIIVADDMLLSKDMPTTAGSKMLEGYISPIEAEAIARLKAKGYAIGGKSAVGEFALDLLGETSNKGALISDCVLKNASAEIVLSGEAVAALCLDTNGYVRRAAAQSGLVSLKPTYGTVSRFGVIPVSCSGDTISILSKDSESCSEILNIIKGHDAKDGTSLPEELYKSPTPVRRIAVIKDFMNNVSTAVSENIAEKINFLKSEGFEVTEIDNAIIPMARAAWNVIMCAELCSSLSRYDGVKYGHRTETFSNLDELYTQSRTEGFGELIKYAVLFGSETLSPENYMKIYDKSLRMRRVLSQEFEKLFSAYDALLIPAVSTHCYTKEMIESDKALAFKENLYTAPASITGLPSVVAGGVQLMGRAYSENTLLDVAKILSEGGKAI